MHSNNSVRKIALNYTIALIPLIFYGFYKNGIIVYQNYQENFYYLFKPLLFPVFAFFIGSIADKLLFKNEPQESFTPVLTTISAMILPSNTSLIIYLITLIVTLIVSRYLLKNINYALIPKLIIFIVLLNTGSYTYLNYYEINSDLHYNLLDIFFGRSYGGIASTSSILCLIGYIFLCNTKVYKKEIPPIIITTFILTSLCFIPVIGLTKVFNNFFNSTVLFASIYIATLPMYSPITRKEIIIYSVLIGIISGILVNLLLPMEGVYITLFIVPILLIIISKILKK